MNARGTWAAARRDYAGVRARLNGCGVVAGQQPTISTRV